MNHDDNFMRHVPLIAFGCLLLAACSPEQRYDVLAVLFDGVPPPGEIRVETTTVSPQYIGLEVARAPVQFKLFRHKPTVNDQCGNCHPPQRIWVGEAFDRRGGCFDCHVHEALRERIDRYPFVHGPVAVLACLACHDPHDSPYEGLLHKPDPKLCYGCHDQESVLSRAAHQEQSEERCLGCHDPHGGTQRYFLRAEAQL